MAKLYQALFKPNQFVNSMGVTKIFENDSQWYALQTHFRHEKHARDRLFSVGVEPFLPLSTQCRQWSDRTVRTAVPLFTGYCFARFALIDTLTVLKTPGIIRIIGIPKPEPIHPDEIIALQKVSSTDRVMEQWNHITDGAWVEVVHGPLAGLRGQLVRKEKQHGLVIRVSLIQQAALIHIKADEVAAIQEISPSSSHPSRQRMHDDNGRHAKTWRYPSPPESRFERS
ncbi:MAG: transcription termination/antitermination NusG family protein [Nitrospira sp.]